MDYQMSSCPWEPIEDFHSRAEFERFHLWMKSQIEAGSADETPVAKPYLGAETFTEKWFQHRESNSIWRLVWPDGPFTGLFEPVAKSTEAG
jgi:hypothetical protein